MAESASLSSRSTAPRKTGHPSLRCITTLLIICVAISLAALAKQAFVIYSLHPQGLNIVQGLGPTSPTNTTSGLTTEPATRAAAFPVTTPPSQEGGFENPPGLEVSLKVRTGRTSKPKKLPTKQVRPRSPDLKRPAVRPQTSAGRRPFFITRTVGTRNIFTSFRLLLRLLKFW